MKKEMFSIALIFMCIISMSYLVVAESVVSSVSVSFESGSSDNKDVLNSSFVSRTLEEFNLKWILILVVIIVIALVIYLFYSRRKTKRISRIIKKRKK